MLIQDSAGEKFLRIADVLPIIGVSESTLKRWVKCRMFPVPVRLGPRACAFKASEVEAWKSSRARVSV